MKKIDKIVFKNFKAFHGEQALGLNSKNLLLYGENGSGKSSIFWGLYTFLQSTTKKQNKIQEYFMQFDEANPLTFSSLKNIYASATEEAFIELHTKDETVGNVVVDHIKFSDSTTDIDKNNLEISLANAASDFINYKFLHNFYNVTHKQEINLWKVFEHDIFPFFRRTEGNTKYYQEEIEELTKDVPRKNGGAKRSGGPKDIYNEKIEDLNERIELFLTEINHNANLFLKKNFFDNVDKIRLELSYRNQISYEKVERKSDDYSIILSLDFFDKVVNNWVPIKRPQSFLNESQLTRIAIAVRIGALQTRVTNSDYKILCLDDMLISLDMGNREKVIKTFLNTEKKEELKYFDEFQKVIFTHDRGFYNLCKQRIETDLNKNDWVFKEMYFDDESSPPKPYMVDNSNDFTKAEGFLKSFDYPAAANSLRQGLEGIIRNILPKSKKSDIQRGQTESKDLDGHLKAFEGILDRFHQNKTLINDLFIYKKHILNPFSHNNIDSPIFKEEIKKVLEVIPTLKNVEMKYLKEVSMLVNKGKFQDRDIHGESHVFEFEFYEDIISFKLLDGRIYIYPAQCKLLKCTTNGRDFIINRKFDTIKDMSNYIALLLDKLYFDDALIISKFRF